MRDRQIKMSIEQPLFRLYHRFCILGKLNVCFYVMVYKLSNEIQ